MCKIAGNVIGRFLDYVSEGEHPVCKSIVLATLGLAASTASIACLYYGAMALYGSFATGMQIDRCCEVISAKGGVVIYGPRNGTACSDSCNELIGNENWQRLIMLVGLPVGFILGLTGFGSIKSAVANLKARRYSPLSTSTEEL